MKCKADDEIVIDSFKETNQSRNMSIMNKKQSEKFPSNKLAQTKLFTNRLRSISTLENANGKI